MLMESTREKYRQILVYRLLLCNSVIELFPSVILRGLSKFVLSNTVANLATNPYPRHVQENPYQTSVVSTTLRRENVCNDC